LILIFHDVQHADLLQTLHDLASSAGARVTFGAIVESVEPAPDPSSESGRSTSIAGYGPSTLRPTVRLKTGEVLQADVIVGADGLRSIVRRVVSDDDEETEPTLTGLNTYMGGVPMSEVRQCAPLKQLADVGWMVWMGDGRIVFGASSVITFTNSGRRSPHTDYELSLESRFSRRESEYTPGGGDKLMTLGPFITETTRGNGHPYIVGRS
jgi:2-polyprenyl-6-methoxyphenol hydroxylase-like FAD-dependent oxidoreductase